jgi:hypothetical protein
MTKGKRANKKGSMNTTDWATRTTQKTKVNSCAAEEQAVPATL